MQITAPQSDVALPQDIKAKIEAVKANLSLAESEVKRLAGVKRSLENEVADLLKKNSDAEEVRKELSASVEALKAEKSALVEVIAQANAELNAARAELATIVTEKNKLVTFINSL